MSDVEEDNNDLFSASCSDEEDDLLTKNKKN